VAELEPAVGGAVGVDAVVAVVVGSQVASPKTLDAVPVDRDLREVPDRQVLDGDAVHVDRHPVVPLELAVERDSVAIPPTQRYARRRDLDRLRVRPRRHENQVALRGRVDARLNSGSILRDANRVYCPRRPAIPRVAMGAVSPTSPTSPVARR